MANVSGSLCGSDPVSVIAFAVSSVAETDCAFATGVLPAAVAVKSMSNDKSLLLPAFWCISTASTFVPSRSNAAFTAEVRSVVSSAPPMAAGASVVWVIVPVGRLFR